MRQLIGTKLIYSDLDSGYMRGREIFEKYKFIFVFFVAILNVFPVKLRKKILVAVRKKRGKIGMGMRYVLLKSISPKIGDNVSVHEDVYLFFPENLEIGSNVSIHPMSYIDACGGIQIGNDVSIAHATSILSSSHLYDNCEIPINNQGVVMKETVIGNDVWIGSKATILYGVNVGDGCIVGANSLVNKSIEPFHMVGGVPARILKGRK